MRYADRSTAADVAFFVALMATALALGGALAHALELPNKIGLSQPEYFTAQKLYRGWNQLAYLLAVELTGILAVIHLYRSQRRVREPALAALGFLLSAQGVFWLFTFPANRATGNWTLPPSNWETLRIQWEYSHLAGAAFQLMVMACLILAVLRRKPFA
jgi:hypothetical protein